MTSRPIPSALLELAVITLVSILAIYSLTGSITPSSVSIPFGTFILTTNEAGIALYQKQLHSNYQVSPYYDYLVYRDGTTTALLGQEGAQTSTPPLIPVLDQIRTHLGLYAPRFTAVSDLTTTYTANQLDNELVVKRTVTGDTVRDAQTSVMAISYSRDDVILDENGYLYTDSPQTIVDFVQSTYNLPITKVQTFDTRIAATASGSLTIINPSTAGILTITAQGNQSFIVDKSLKRIEIHEPVSPQSMRLETQTRITYVPSLGGEQ